MTLEGPIGQERQVQDSPFHRELFASKDNLANVMKDELNLGKDAVKLVKDIATTEAEGLTGVAKYLKAFADQFEKFGDKMLMALKPHEHKELNDNINKMGCPMAKLRAALSKNGADSAKEDSDESGKKRSL